MDGNAIRKLSRTAATLCVAAIGLSACSDSDSSSNPGGRNDVLSVKVGNLNVAADGDTLLFEVADYDFEMNVASTGEWRVVDQSGFFESISPESGSGDAIVKIHLSRNESENSRSGEMRIVFPADTNLNNSVALKQKYSGDYDENTFLDVVDGLIKRTICLLSGDGKSACDSVK